METEHEEFWRKMLSEGNSIADKSRVIFRALPHDPRCMTCHAPFEGYGGRLMGFLGRGRSSFDPRFCRQCEKFGQRYPGGAYVDLAMIFADVRGSTVLAERIGDREFSQLINRFFRVSAAALIHADAFIDRLAGDEAIGFFVPGLAGPQFAKKALQSGQDLLRATGHAEPDGPWVPVGVGAHVGNAYVGMVGSRDGVSDFTALGDDINVGARIASAAGIGEVLASLDLCRAAGVDTQDFEHRMLSLKGKQDHMEVAVVPLD